MSGAHVVILGAGHAGGTAAALLRQYGHEGPVTLVGEEPIPPYQRPPLSKAWLKGEADADSLSLKLATLRESDCIGMLTTQTLGLYSAQGIVPIDHAQLQFRREAGIIRRRYADMSPSVKLLVAELRKVAVKYGPT